MEKEYIVAKGPEKLEQVLDDLLEKSKQDSAIKSRAHYILYELGKQKSIIKVDMSEWPVVFWHYDLLGRPATSTVKDVIARFAWEKCGEREWYFKENSLTEDAFSHWRQQIFEARDRE